MRKPVVIEESRACAVGKLETVAVKVDGVEGAVRRSGRFGRSVASNVVANLVVAGLFYILGALVTRFRVNLLALGNFIFFAPPGTGLMVVFAATMAYQYYGPPEWAVRMMRSVSVFFAIFSMSWLLFLCARASSVVAVKGGVGLERVGLTIVVIAAVTVSAVCVLSWISLVAWRFWKYARIAASLCLLYGVVLVFGVIAGVLSVAPA